MEPETRHSPAPTLMLLRHTTAPVWPTIWLCGSKACDVPLNFQHRIFPSWIGHTPIKMWQAWQN